MQAIHHLDGTLQENLHGWFDGGLEPRVTVEPGDRVVYRVPDAIWDRDAPYADSQTDRPRLTRPQGAGHALTGPVRIQGAESGDALAVRILEVLTRDWAVAGHAPGKEGAISGVLGGQSDDVVDDYLIRLSLDRARGVWRFGERVEVPLAPFVGVFGVAPARGGRTPTARPGPHGGNIDCKELRAGATVYLPVFVSGALFSVGDGHGAQGEGEVDGAAVETGMERLVLEFGLVKGAGLKRPRAATDTHLIFLAFHQDLEAAVLEATRDVMGYLTARRGLTRHEAYALASIAADFRISQVVNGLKGVHAMLPKALFEGGAT